MRTTKVATAPNIEYEPAGLGTRILATGIDYLMVILICVLVILACIIGVDGYGNIALGLPRLIGIFVAVAVFYDILLEVILSGQTIGKKVMKIKVISIDGQKARFGQYVIRWLMRTVDFGILYGIGPIISVLSTEKSQRIGDLLAGTTVVRATPRTK